jgi:Zn-dependent peptidase ImmA (M78 family)
MARQLNPKIRDFLEEKLSSDMRENGAPDLEKFAKKIGISNIWLAKFNKEGVSGLLKKEGDEWNIYVHHADSPRRRRFTIAHEIGHFVSYLNDGASKTALADKGQVTDFAFTRLEQGSPAAMEAEANAIAARILMPEGDVRNLLEKTKAVEEMAGYFQVSESAMMFRLSDLGITPLESYGRRAEKSE